MKRLIAFALALFMTLSMMGCGNVADKIYKELENGNYEKAGELYTEKASGNMQTEEEVITKLYTSFSENAEKYNNGEITYEEALVLLDATVRSGIVDQWEMENAYAYLNRLKYSKERFAYAEDCFADGWYYEAYDAYREVGTEDANYEKAQEMMVEAESANLREVAEKMAELQDQKAFDDAYAYIEEQMNVWGRSSALETEEENLMNRWADNNIAEAEVLIGSHQYAEALQKMGLPFLYHTPEMYTEEEKIYAEWKAYSVELAEAAFGGPEKNYQAAIDALMSTGLDASYLTEEVAHYESYIPIELTEMDPVKHGDYITRGTSGKDSYKDVNGNTYNTLSCISPRGGDFLSQIASTEEESAMVFYLNAEFDTFSGMLYRPYSTLQADASIWDTPTVVKIYGDGALLYEAPRIDGSTYENIRFEVSVAGVRELRIVMQGVWTKSDPMTPAMYIRYPMAVMTDMWIQR